MQMKPREAMEGKPLPDFSRMNQQTIDRATRPDETTSRKKNSHYIHDLLPSVLVTCRSNGSSISDFVGSNSTDSTEIKFFSLPPLFLMSTLKYFALRWSLRLIISN